MAGISGNFFWTVTCFPAGNRFSNLCVRSISWILFTSHFTTENELPTRAIPSGLWSPDEIFLHHLPPSTIFLTPSCWWAQAAGTLCIPEGQSPKTTWHGAEGWDWKGGGAGWELSCYLAMVVYEQKEFCELFWTPVMHLSLTATAWHQGISISY